MPKPDRVVAKDSRTATARPVPPSGATKKKEMPKQITTEVDAFLQGLYVEFAQQAEKYHGLTQQLCMLEARVEMVEKNLRVTRDHFAMAVERAATSTVPRNWTKVFKGVEFVGMRLADACVKLLKERHRMTPQELLHALNTGMFRFRTGSPLREIHGALLRHPSVKKNGTYWVWTGENDSQPRLRVVESTEPDEEGSQSAEESA